MNIVIPVAGRGTRTSEYGVPKPLIPVDNVPMVELAARSLGIPGRYIFVRLWYENREWNDKLTDVLAWCMPNTQICTISEVTEGPACSALVAKPFIDTDEPLIIANCDQAMQWDSKKFLAHLKANTDDGIVVTYGARTTKNSYIRLDEYGYGIEIREKEIISEHSLNGIHYWRHGKDFVSSAEEMIRRNIRVNGEFYIAPTYNMLIEWGMKISTYRVKDDEHFAIGVPQDIQRYLERKHGTTSNR